MVTTCLPTRLPDKGTRQSEGPRARPVALELNKHHAEQV
jgi:hypothetical protein